jgi:hypothetical protein
MQDFHGMPILCPGTGPALLLLTGFYNKCPLQVQGEHEKGYSVEKVSAEIFGRLTDQEYEPDGWKQPDLPDCKG